MIHSTYNRPYNFRQYQQYLQGAPAASNMLDCKMSSSLSPITPVNLQQEPYMEIWDHESLTSGHTKLTDMIDIMEHSIGQSNGTSPTATIHHPSRDQFSHQQYLTPLPPLGDPYSSSECTIMDAFQCPPVSEPSFQKLSDGSSYSEVYESFMSDFSQGSLQHQGSNSGLVLNTTGLHHGGGQCSPGCLCSANTFVPSLSADSTLANSFHASGNVSHQEYNWEDLHCDPADYSVFLPKGDSPTNSDSISYTDNDSELDSKSSGGSHSTIPDICHVSPPKRKVGRPPKKDKKMKRNEKKTGRLWEFIRDLLKNPDYCPSLVRWENPEEGHFRFVNSEKVAQLWGQIKGNPRMTYEKLSRAMRYYYKSHVFEPVLGRRLVYKFGYNATNWKPVNPNFSSLQKLYPS